MPQLKAMNLTVEQIAQATGLSVEQIEALNPLIHCIRGLTLC